MRCEISFLRLLPLFIKDQKPVHKDQQPVGPVASANSGDEDSEKSDEYSAQSQDSGRTVPYPDLYVMMIIGQWRLTHKYAAAAGSFCFATTVKEISRIYSNLTTMPCVQRSFYLNEMINNFRNIQVEVPKGGSLS